MRICKQDNNSILRSIYSGEVDAISISTTSLVDEVILSMHRHGILSCVRDAFPDKRASNTAVPFDIILALAIASKMRQHTSLTDIPFALTDHRTLSELGYAIYGDDLSDGIMSD